MNIAFPISLVLLIFSYILTFIIKRVAERHSILDLPNERSSHEVPTPRGGGVAIVISWFIGISLFRYFNIIEGKLYLALLSGLILAVVSLIDDIIKLPAYIRLIAQFITASIALLMINEISPIIFLGFSINNPVILILFALIGIVWFVNLFNFLDGIDGYASMETIAVCAAIYVFTGDYLGILVIASVSGFLIWNWPKAKIFMGDIGSTQLGFILAILGIYHHNQMQLSFIQWLMLTSLFWFDATFTLLRRWRNKEKLSVAHRKHVYQRAVQSGVSQLKIILISFAINLFLIGAVLISRKYNNLIEPLFLANILFLYLITRLVDRRVPFR